MPIIFTIVVLIFSAVIHEVSHGYAAYFLGDNTAERAGRLTLNPFKHMEWFGSVMLPAISYLSGGLIIGWAKPVPFNPYNLQPQKWGLPQRAGEAIVAMAGPLANIVIALVLGLLLRFGMFPSLVGPLGIVVFINLTLAVFNLVPIPPLDGSKILFSVFPYSWHHFQRTLERNQLFVLVIFVLFIWQYIEPLINFIFFHLTGILS